MALASIVAGQIAYAGFIFNASWIVSTIAREVGTETSDRAFTRGYFAAPGKPGPKTFKCLGSFGGLGAIKDQNGFQMTTADQVQAEIDRLAPLMYMGDQPFQWRTDRYVMAQASKPEITYSTGNGYRIPSVTIDFVANDPLEISSTAKALSCNSGSSVSATNAGSYRAYPTIVLTFSSACVNPTVKIATPDTVGYIQLNLTGTFATSDVVTIVTDPTMRSISKNGVKTWSVLAMPIVNTFPSTDSRAYEVMPFLDPGTSTVTIAATSGSASASLAFSDCWI